MLLLANKGNNPTVFMLLLVNKGKNPTVFIHPTAVGHLKRVLKKKI
jgi:hypothetical protein